MARTRGTMNAACEDSSGCRGGAHGEVYMRYLLSEQHAAFIEPSRSEALASHTHACAMAMYTSVATHLRHTE